MSVFFGAGGMGGNVERHIGDDDRDGAAIEALQPGGNGMTHAARDVLAERDEARAQVAAAYEATAVMRQWPDPLTSDMARALEHHRESLLVEIMSMFDQMQRQLDYSRGGKLGPADPPQPSETVAQVRALADENARLNAAMLVLGAYLMEKGEAFRVGEGAELLDAYSAALRALKGEQ